MQNFVHWSQESSTYIILIRKTTFTVKILYFKDYFQSALRNLESLRFRLILCKTSQNVKTCQLMTWSKFKVSKQPTLCMQRSRSFYCFVLSYITWRNNFRAIKINETVGKEFERPQRYVLRFIPNNTDSHSIEWASIIFINSKAMRLCSMDWKIFKHNYLRKWFTNTLNYCSLSEVLSVDHKWEFFLIHNKIMLT